MSTPTEPAQPPAQPEPHDDTEGDPTPVRRPVQKTFPNLHRRPRPAEPAPAEPVLVAQPATRNRTPRRRPRITPPTQEELDALPVEKRQELHDARRQRPWQHLTSLGVLFGVLFTAGGLYYTGQTWQTGQEALKATQQQQITDRYAKAVEQLGSAKSVEVRIGGLYALKRIARDSPPDAETIEDVVVAFILEHDLDVAATPAPKGTPLKASARRRPGSDVSAALRVLGVIAKSRGSQPDISSAQFAQADWRGVNLSGAYLSSVSLNRVNLAGANLNGADLSRANLSRANLSDSDLRDADLGGADLRGATLSGADLRGATLIVADLSGADLSGADLSGADLRGADLIVADLRDADLYAAYLNDADLSGADLRGITGKTAAEIKAVAFTNDKTRF